MLRLPVDGTRGRGWASLYDNTEENAMSNADRGAEHDPKRSIVPEEEGRPTSPGMVDGEGGAEPGEYGEPIDGLGPDRKDPTRDPGMQRPM
jgi:hypothetical protein